MALAISKEILELSPSNQICHRCMIDHISQKTTHGRWWMYGSRTLDIDRLVRSVLVDNEEYSYQQVCTRSCSTDCAQPSRTAGTFNSLFNKLFCMYPGSWIMYSNY